jgi:hypothetical protein
MWARAARRPEDETVAPGGNGAPEYGGAWPDRPVRAAAGGAMARWSAKALLITGGVLLVGSPFWYARAPTVPLIVAALAPPS